MRKRERDRLVKLEAAKAVLDSAVRLDKLATKISDPIDGHTSGGASAGSLGMVGSGVQNGPTNEYVEPATVNHTVRLQGPKGQFALIDLSVRIC